MDRHDSPKRLIQEAIENLDSNRAQPWSCTFLHDIPDEVREKVEAQLRHSFELWAGTWVIPPLRMALAKMTPLKHRTEEQAKMMLGIY